MHPEFFVAPTLSTATWLLLLLLQQLLGIRKKKHDGGDIMRTST